MKHQTHNDVDLKGVDPKKKPAYKTRRLATTAPLDNKVQDFD